MPSVYHRPYTSWTLPVMDGPGLWIESWSDPVVERLGHPVNSTYTERFWLPVLGPTATWVMRHLDARLHESPGGLHLDITASAQAIGVATTSGTKGPFARALSRCCIFGLAQPLGDGLLVRRVMPPLPSRYRNRLPPALRSELSAKNAAPRGG